LYIVDARPRANALANGAKGGGSESSSNYPKSEVRIYAQMVQVALLYTLIYLFNLLDSEPGSLLRNTKHPHNER
jgi:hypothetical protein